MRTWLLPFLFSIKLEKHPALRRERGVMQGVFYMGQKWRKGVAARLCENYLLFFLFYG
jgi:hypothetical protein